MNTWSMYRSCLSKKKYKSYNVACHVVKMFNQPVYHCPLCDTIGLSCITCAKQYKIKALAEKLEELNA